LFFTHRKRVGVAEEFSFCHHAAKQAANLSALCKERIGLRAGNIFA